MGRKEDVGEREEAKKRVRMRPDRKPLFSLAMQKSVGIAEEVKTAGINDINTSYGSTTMHERL